ncbi:hypothetical protein V8F33_003571 [Rhypophila sp. PSN 637]
MRFTQVLAAVGLVAPIGVTVAAPAREDLSDFYENFHAKRENLCSLKAPPVLCTPNKSVTVEETAVRAYKFYRAFVVDGTPREMFSYIDNVYKQHNPGYQSGPQAIWGLFCSGRKIGTEQSTSWCFDASTNMSYAKYSTVDRWAWVDGCVHEHWDQRETFPSAEKCYKLDTKSITFP